jgi:hypothetical protein
MKVERMGITEILRRILVFSANKIKASESVSKQSTKTQLIIVTEIRYKSFLSCQSVKINPNVKIQ